MLPMTPAPITSKKTHQFYGRITRFKNIFEHMFARPSKRVEASICHGTLPTFQLRRETAIARAKRGKAK